jgi:shikimate kinase
MTGRGRPERIVLVGFMAAGKSSVGRRLASLLRYRFVDLDEEVEGLAGRPIPEIFEARGEAGFREFEVRATEALDELRPVVVAAGGGWMTRPALRDRWPDAVRVWLRVSPPIVVRRLRDQLDSRPLLDPSEPEDSVRRILDERLGDYARAELAVDTDGRTIEQVADRVLELLELG